MQPSEIGGDADVTVGVGLQSDRINGYEVHGEISAGTDGFDLTVGESYSDGDTHLSISVGISDDGLGAVIGGTHDIIEEEQGGFAIGAGAEISDDGFDIGPNVEVFGETLGLRVSTTDVRVVERNPETDERKRYSVNPISVVINELFGSRSALDVVVCGGDVNCDGVPLGIFSFITDWLSDLLGTKDIELKTNFNLPHGVTFDAEKSVLRASNGVEIKVILNKIETTAEVVQQVVAEPMVSGKLSLLVFEDGTAFTTSGKALSRADISKIVALHAIMNPNSPSLVIIEPLALPNFVTVDDEINDGKSRINERGPVGAPVTLDRAEEVFDEVR